METGEAVSSPTALFYFCHMILVNDLNADDHLGFSPVQVNAPVGMKLLQTAQHLSIDQLSCVSLSACLVVMQNAVTLSA